MDKKIFELTIDELDSESGVYAVGLVSAPAIEVNWVKLSKPVKLKADASKQLLTGPLMIPNQEILRTDVEGNEYYIFYSEETIKKASEKFSKSAYQSHSSHQHLVPLYNNTVVESWIVEDSEKDKSNLYGFSLPKGTWMISLKVSDKNYWDKYVANDEVKGFSLEGLFNEIKIEQNEKMQQIKLNTFEGEYELLSGDKIYADADLNVTYTFTETGEVITEGLNEEYRTKNDYIVYVLDSMLYTITSLEVESLLFLPEEEMPMETEDNTEEMNKVELIKDKKKYKKLNKKKKRMTKIQELYAWLKKGRNFFEAENMENKSENNTEVKLMEYTLEDGTVINLDEDGKANVIDAEGNVIGYVMFVLAEPAINETAESTEVSNPSYVAETKLEKAKLEKELAETKLELEKIKLAADPIKVQLSEFDKSKNSPDDVINRVRELRKNNYKK